jgi:signal transduction histidine kinase
VQHRRGPAKDKRFLVQWLSRESDRRNAFSSDFHALSHDLRTPLNHINGFAELLLLGGGLDGAQQSYVEAILRASEALQTTVLAYLERAQPESPGKA